ncbi:MAG: hypothetical protein V3T41_05125 [bacterium]
MAEEIEDPIEAIKRRNEERARRLKERIASGEFDKFETPLEEVDESLVPGPEAIEAPEGDFDLSSFPAPPEPSAIPLDEERAEAVPEPPEVPPMAPPEMPSEFAPGAEAAAFLEPPGPEPPPVEEPAEEALAGLELTELDLEGVGEVIAPQPWDAAELPAVEAEAPPVEEEVPAEVVPTTGLEIEVGPGAEFPLEGLVEPLLEEEVVAAAEPAVVSEPTLREEEAEAIKATIEEELREVPPVAPPMPPRPEEVPVGVAAEAAPAPAPAPPAAEEPVVEEEAEIFIGIGVVGNKVRVERRNITLAATIDLFRSIINRYQNR